MSAFIIGGIILITAVNWLYSRFCDNRRIWPAVARAQIPGSEKRWGTNTAKGEPL
ncbi:MAG TPA: hypothetical protein VFQ78_05115 [Candidatus Udaeobacter sp.]|nr:hypothetical protein [Candidatus Udaeobacter sp.]